MMSIFVCRYLGHLSDSQQQLDGTSYIGSLADQLSDSQQQLAGASLTGSLADLMPLGQDIAVFYEPGQVN